MGGKQVHRAELSGAGHFDHPLHSHAGAVGIWANPVRNQPAQDFRHRCLGRRGCESDPQPAAGTAIWDCWRRAWHGDTAELHHARVHAASRLPDTWNRDSDIPPRSLHAPFGGVYADGDRSAADATLVCPTWLSAAGRATAYSGNGLWGGLTLDVSHKPRFSSR